MFEFHISDDAFERLHVWCQAKCPRALEDPEFLPGLIVVVEEEVEKALRSNCWKHIRAISEPCRQ